MLGRPKLNESKIKSIERGFIFSAKNQQAFDSIYYKLCNHNINDFHGIPRPAAWLKRNNTPKSTIKFFSKTLTLLWCNIFFHIHIIYKLSATLFLHKPSTKKIPHNKIIAYAINEHSCRTILKIATQRGDITWITPSNKNITTTTKENLQIISCASILDKREILFTAKQCLAIHRHIIKYYDKELAWQNYAMFDWILTYEATTRLHPQTILISEHHDRWAVLADSYCTQQKNTTKECTIELTQHGNEYTHTYDLIREITKNSCLPYKLKNVSRLNVYNDEQLEIFKNHILDPHTPPKSVQTIKNNIVLTKIPTNSLSILFVGHPFCEEFQLALYNKLKSNNIIDFYYKPHPAAKSNINIKNSGWHYIADRNFYPKVDLIISYPSTLVNEYDSEKIHAIVHPIQTQNESIDIYVAKTLNFLKINKN